MRLASYVIRFLKLCKTRQTHLKNSQNQIKMITKITLQASNILADNVLYTRISVEGRKFIEKKFQWHETTIELIEILNN